jgi:hypothetical protein
VLAENPTLGIKLVFLPIAEICLFNLADGKAKDIHLSESLTLVRLHVLESFLQARKLNKVGMQFADLVFEPTKTIEDPPVIFFRQERLVLVLTMNIEHESGEFVQIRERHGERLNVRSASTRSFDGTPDYHSPVLRFNPSLREPRDSLRIVLNSKRSGHTRFVGSCSDGFTVGAGTVEQ